MMENTTTLNAYLLDGPEDIKTEEDVQAYLDGFYEKQEAFRQFLIKTKISKSHSTTALGSKNTRTKQKKNVRCLKLPMISTN